VTIPGIGCYPDGVLVSILRNALPGTTIETNQAPDLEDRVPYVCVHAGPGSVDLSLNLVNTTVTIDVWAKPSKRTAWTLAGRVIAALVNAWKDQTTTPDGYLKYIDTSGDLPQETRLLGQAADLFHYQWTAVIGVRPPE